jgi:hypothetical protein
MGYRSAKADHCRDSGSWKGYAQKQSRIRSLFEIPVMQGARCNDSVAAVCSRKRELGSAEEKSEIVGEQCLWARLEESMTIEVD